jgi:putative PIN family toxin of toxin-antitoxin system
MRIFLDTNVLVSSAATRGLCADVLREVLINHQLVVSAPLLTELKNALRKKLGVPDDLTAELVEILQQDSHFSTSSPLADIGIKEKDDLIILSSALNGGADLFITGDKKLLELSKVGNMEIVSPRTFWEKLKAQPPNEL